MRNLPQRCDAPPKWPPPSARGLRVQGLMNALRALSAVIARWRLRRIAKRRLRDILRRDNVRQGGLQLEVLRGEQGHGPGPLEPGPPVVVHGLESHPAYQ